MVQFILSSYTVYTIALCTCQYLNGNLGSFKRLYNVYCLFTERFEWIALAVAVNLVGSRVLLESRPARSVMFWG